MSDEVGDVPSGSSCWIPPHLYADPDLSPTVKITGGRIFALAHKDGYCYASPEYLAEDRGVSKSTVRYHVRELIEAGYITRQQVHEGEGRGSERVLVPVMAGEAPAAVINRWYEDQRVGSRGPAGESNRSDLSNNRDKSREGESGGQNGDLFDDDTSPGVAKVWEHYQSLYARRYSERRSQMLKLDACSRRTKITSRLEEGYSPKDLIRAINGYWHDEWHAERNKDDLEYMLRNQSKVEDGLKKRSRQEDEEERGASDRPSADDVWVND